MSTQARDEGPLGALANTFSSGASTYENNLASQEAQQGQTQATQALGKALSGGYAGVQSDPSSYVAAMGNQFLPAGSSQAATDYMSNQQKLNTPEYQPGGFNGQPPGFSVAGGGPNGGPQFTPINASAAPVGTTGSATVDQTADGYGTKAVAGGLTQAAIDQAALSDITSGQRPTGGRSGMTIQQATAISNRMAEMDPSGNLAKNKAQVSALTQSLAQQQKYADTTDRAVSNAEAGMQQAIGAFQGKVNVSQYPTVNAAVNASQAQLDPGTISAYKAALQEVANEYTQVFSRGGQATDAVRAKSQAIVNGDLSLADLQQVLTELQAQGHIVVQGARNQVQKINDQISSIASGGSPDAPPPTTGAPATADPLGIL